MPHFFSLRRSRDQDRYNTYDPYDSHRSQPSAWSRVIPSSRRDDVNWQEELVDYPDSYSGQEDYYNRRRHERPSGRDYARRPRYDVQSESTETATDEPFGDSRYYTRDNAVPIVQRESSLTRLQEVFSDHAAGNASRPVTEVPIPPQGTPRQNPVEVQQPPPPQPTAELRSVYPAQQPILVQNSSADSVEADIGIQHSQSYRPREAQDASRYPSRTEMRREPSSSGRPLGEEEYPPCVVVVERGRHGKADTYYVIPGGAPVIFEDESGNELTRVGDFSGRYRPRKQRPVIIEDEHGREVGRLGFDDQSSLDYQYRTHSDDGLYGRDRGYGYQHHPRDEYRPNYDKASSRSSPSNSQFYYPSQERNYQRNPEVDPRGMAKPFPNVVYVPWTSGDRRSSSRHSSQSSTRNYAQSQRSHQPSSNVIHLDDYRRGGTGSVSSGSSGSRSYGSYRSR